jgi:hypothetical protein
MTHLNSVSSSLLVPSLRFKYSPQHLVLRDPQCLYLYENPICTAQATTGQIIVFCILIKDNKFRELRASFIPELNLTNKPFLMLLSVSPSNFGFKLIYV